MTKNAIDISLAKTWNKYFTTYTEGIISLVGILVYLLSGSPFPWHLAPSLLLGAVLSVPLAAFAVIRIPAPRLTIAIGGLSTILGAHTLLNLII